METKQTKNIIQQFFQNEQSAEHKERFGRWLTHSFFTKEKNEIMLELWSEETAGPTDVTLHDLEILHKRMGYSQKKQINFNHFYRVAAAVLFLITGSLTGYLFFNKTIPEKEVKMLQCFVPNGERKTIVLPDGSAVWLNAGSLMVYPEVFNGKTRSVYLYGKAEFKVAKNPDKPFIVKTEKIDVQALGTVFTVTSYNDDSVTLAMLIEGKVQVDFTELKNTSRILQPNELLTYSHITKKISLSSINTELMSKWKDGYLIFQTAKLSDIFRDVERRHNVKIIYDNSKWRDGVYNIKFTPKEGVKENMEVIKALIDGLNYKIKDNIVIIN